MDNASVPPVAEAYTPAGELPAANPQTPSQPLGQENLQAPSPTGGSGQQAAPESPTPPTTFDPSQYISKDEYEALQQKLQEKDSVLDQLRTMAEEQRKAEQASQFKASVRNQLAAAYQQAADMPDSERAIDLINQEVEKILNAVTQNYQQEVDQYHQSVEQSMWELRAPSLASDLIRQHDLDPGIRDDLLALGNEQAMTQYALRAKQLRDQFQQQFGQQAAARQADQMRQSGVTVMGGEGPANQPYVIPESGTKEELMPVLRQIFGL